MNSDSDDDPFPPLDAAPKAAVARDSKLYPLLQEHLKSEDERQRWARLIIARLATSVLLRGTRRRKHKRMVPSDQMDTTHSETKFRRRVRHIVTRNAGDRFAVYNSASPRRDCLFMDESILLRRCSGLLSKFGPTVSSSRCSWLVPTEGASFVLLNRSFSAEKAQQKQRLRLWQVVVALSARMERMTGRLEEVYVQREQESAAKLLQGYMRRKIRQRRLLAMPRCGNGSTLSLSCPLRYPFLTQSCSSMRRFRVILTVVQFVVRTQLSIRARHRGATLLARFLRDAQQGAFGGLAMVHRYLVNVRRCQHAYHTLRAVTLARLHALLLVRSLCLLPLSIFFTHRSSWERLRLCRCGTKSSRTCY